MVKKPPKEVNGVSGPTEGKILRLISREQHP